MLLALIISVIFVQAQQCPRLLTGKETIVGEEKIYSYLKELNTKIRAKQEKVIIDMHACILGNSMCHCRISDLCMYLHVDCNF